MLKKHANPAVGSDFFLANAKDFKQALKLSHDHLKFIWNRNTHPLELLVDGSPLTLFPNQVLCCTYLQHINCELMEDADLLLLSFNKTSLNAKEKEVINLIVSQVNGCSYCLAAHTAVGKMNVPEAPTLS